jgi:hypothetical protein
MYQRGLNAKAALEAQVDGSGTSWKSWVERVGQTPSLERHASQE